MKRLLTILLLLPVLAFTQESLMVEGTTPDLYLKHTVAAKENYYSIGRLYHISPKEIAPYNKLQLEKGLVPGQSIRIPLNSANLSINGAAASDEALVPIYYTVKEKEGLYRIGVNHNKVPVETLKQWNNIQGESVANGTKLVVGYLRVKRDESALAKQSVNVKKVNAPVKVDEVAVFKENESKAIVEPAVSETPQPVKAKEPAAPVVNRTGKSFNGGVFKSTYDNQTRGNSIDKEGGEAAVFKSTSGWEDGKYYCLHNGTPAGTVIKITSTLTGRSVYAKVLDLMPDIKQNTGLVLRISSAAASELGVGETKFDCTLNFSK